MQWLENLLKRFNFGHMYTVHIIYVIYICLAVQQIKRKQSKLILTHLDLVVISNYTHLGTYTCEHHIQCHSLITTHIPHWDDMYILYMYMYMHTHTPTHKFHSYSPKMLSKLSTCTCTCTISSTCTCTISTTCVHTCTCTCSNTPSVNSLWVTYTAGNNSPYMFVHYYQQHIWHLSLYGKNLGSETDTIDTWGRMGYGRGLWGVPMGGLTFLLHVALWLRHLFPI